MAAACMFVSDTMQLQCRTWHCVHLHLVQHAVVVVAAFAATDCSAMSAACQSTLAVLNCGVRTLVKSCTRLSV